MRVLLERDCHPLKIPLVLVGVLGVSVFLWARVVGDPLAVAARTQTARADRAERALSAVRRQKPVGVFRRQTVSKGKGRR